MKHEKNILFSGLSYSKKNNELMIEELKRYSFYGDVIDFGSYESYKHMSDENLIAKLNDNFNALAENDDVNLICHSMGCNFGLILAREKASQIKRAVFLSPELQQSTRQEKQKAKNLKISYDRSIEQPVTMGIFDKISLFKVFGQTKELAKESLKDINNLDSLVCYGVADPFVSEAGAKDLAQKLDGELIQIFTQYHNLLLNTISGENETARQITKFLHK